MAEYIKRSAVFEQFDNADADVCETDDFGGVDYGFGMKNIKELINAISAADVVEVVRCKDCKYNLGTKKCLNPDSFFAVPKDDDFCSYGERREAGR